MDIPDQTPMHPDKIYAAGRSVWIYLINPRKVIEDIHCIDLLVNDISTILNLELLLELSYSTCIA